MHARMVRRSARVRKAAKRCNYSVSISVLHMCRVMCLSVQQGAAAVGLWGTYGKRRWIRALDNPRQLRRQLRANICHYGRVSLGCSKLCAACKSAVSWCRGAAMTTAGMSPLPFWDGNDHHRVSPHRTPILQSIYLTSWLMFCITDICSTPPTARRCGACQNIHSPFH
jgi:hypothetical protein